MMASQVIPTSRSENSKVILAERKRGIFLKLLAMTGNVLKSAQACGYTDTSEFYRARKDDEEFAEAWDLALQAAGDVIEGEAIRRAVDGVQKPILYKGNIVAYETQYSDGLLTTLLKGMKPKYREGGNNVQINTNIGMTVLPMVAADSADWERQVIDLHAKDVTDETKLIEEDKK